MCKLFSVVVMTFAIVIFGCGMLNTINCPDCGNVVSVRAFICPKCGCSREAIQQYVHAIEELSKLPPDQQKKYSNQACFGQIGRLMWMKEERTVRNVLTNEVVALATYSVQQKKTAQEACATVRQMLKMGFTMNQIFVMRHELISAILGKADRASMNLNY